MAAVETISLKVTVEKDKNKVIFAECGKDFVDILLSFLTLPMGTIVRLLRKQSPMEEIGCMNNIYESVENCNAEDLRTEACKTMLLWPRNAAEAQCDILKLKIDDREPTKYYLCMSSGKHPTNTKGFKLLSHYKNARCQCEDGTNLEFAFEDRKVAIKEGGGVFVKETRRFMLSDDLRLLTISTSTILSLLRELGIDKECTLEERTLNLGIDEVLHLLKCSLLSKSSLTDLVFPERPSHRFGCLKLEPRTAIYSRNRLERETKKVSMKLIIGKPKQEVLCAEVGEDFVDLLFSFLTFPLGCIVELLGGSCSLGCIDNLYQSVKDLDADRYMESQERKAMLVSPKLAPDFGYDNHPLHLQEAQHPPYAYRTCYGNNELTNIVTSLHGYKECGVVDPKSNGETTRGVGFVKGPAMFVVTDDLVVTPVHPFSFFSFLKRLNVPFCDVEELLLNLEEDEVLTLFKASLISKNALTSLFTSIKPMVEEYEPATTHVSDQKKPKQDSLFY